MELITTATKDKLRGGFYTPSAIVKFINSWLKVTSVNGDILEPSCGDGNFLSQFDPEQFNSVTGVELDPEEYQKALERCPDAFHILNEDFHEFCNTTKQRFDAVVGNPPYIRYQYFDREQQEQAKKIFDRADLKYSKLMNAWVSFVVGSTLLLKDDGKIAFVLPAELLQVGYAKKLRSFLVQEFKKINIITFKTLVFEDIQQEVVLLFCEKKGKGETKIDHFELKDLKELERFNPKKLLKPSKNIQAADVKWTHYFLNPEEIELIKKINQFDGCMPLRKACKIEVGITTGANPFFTVTHEIVEEYDLWDYAFPMVGRSVQVPSVVMTDDDWDQNVSNGARAYFLKFPPLKKLNKGAKRYIQEAEENHSYHLGYKCRIRDEWQIVPSTRISDGLFIRRNNLFPRLIRNDISAHTTDTMHRVWVRNGYSLDALAGSYYNSLSLAFAELKGRSHGGGVLELMPNEAESILVPYSEDHADLLPKIDNMFRSGKDIGEILQVTNPIILKDHLGMSDAEVRIIEGVRRKLLNRRLSRGNKVI